MVVIFHKIDYRCNNNRITVHPKAQDLNSLMKLNLRPQLLLLV